MKQHRNHRPSLSLVGMSLISLHLSGCAALEMAQAWQLDRIRILGTQSIPAEASPGDTVQFQSLIYAPPSTSIEGIVWFGCLPDVATSFGCTIDSALIEGLSNPPTVMEEQITWFNTLQDAGLLGFEPMLPPTWSIPTTALDTLDDIDKTEGLSGFLNLTALPSSTSDADNIETSNLNDIEVAYTRFPISENPEPNENPTIAHLLINGTEYAPGEIPKIKTGGTLAIDISFQEGAIEDYSYTNPDSNETEIRTEIPYLSFYTEEGEFSNTVSLPPYTEVEWYAPDFATRSEIIITVRDRRGGMDWIRFTVQVEAE